MLSTSSGSGARPVTRIPLACVQCRSRHVKCDGITPTCSRCNSLDIQCEYHKSRRGGKRRTTPSKPSTASPPSDSPAVQPPSKAPQSSNALDLLSLSFSPPTVQSECLSLYTGQPSADGTARGRLLESYYANFHASHPCALPLDFYRQQYQQTPCRLKLLDFVMQFIGSLFIPEVSSDPLDEQVKLSMEGQLSAYDVQAVILYSTAIYWCNDMDRASHLLDRASEAALSLGMHLQQFASDHGPGDAVLAESWRRTWWQLYITNVHVAAIIHASNSVTSQRLVTTTADLPCEEAEYASGNIPEPKNIRDYDEREFVLDDSTTFSSFAYLIGLYRSIDVTIIGHQRNTSAQSKWLCINADCAIKSWLALLPDSKRKMITEDGSLDRLIYKASLSIPVYVVDVHRSLSTLLYDDIESVSSCSPPPPPDTLAPVYLRDAATHTSKILHAIENMTELLTLPTPMQSHTPFAICMISSATIAYLSACKHVYRGEQLRAARERIRAAVGALTAFAAVWPRARTVVQEVKIIARELLGLNAPGHTPGSGCGGADALVAPAPAAHIGGAGLGGLDGLVGADPFDSMLFAAGDGAGGLLADFSDSGYGGLSRPESTETGSRAARMPSSDDFS